MRFLQVTGLTLGVNHKNFIIVRDDQIFVTARFIQAVDKTRNMEYSGPSQPSSNDHNYQKKYVKLNFQELN